MLMELPTLRFLGGRLRMWLQQEDIQLTWSIFVRYPWPGHSKRRRQGEQNSRLQFPFIKLERIYFISWTWISLWKFNNWRYLWVLYVIKRQNLECFVKPFIPKLQNLIRSGLSFPIIGYAWMVCEISRFSNFVCSLHFAFTLLWG